MNGYILLITIVVLMVLFIIRARRKEEAANKVKRLEELRLRASRMDALFARVDHAQRPASMYGLAPKPTAKRVRRSSVLTSAAPADSSNGFITGLVIGELLSSSPAPAPAPAFESGGGGDFGGAGASGSWADSPSPAPSPSYDSSSYDSGSSYSGD